VRTIGRLLAKLFPGVAEDIQGAKISSVMIAQMSGSESLMVRLKVAMVIDQKNVEAGRVLPLNMVPKHLREGKYIAPIPADQYPSTPIRPIVSYDEQ
jgi:hypothetical protein